MRVAINSNKMYRILLLFFILFAGSIIFSSSASAETNFTGANTTPDEYRVRCSGNVPVDFAAYPSNVKLNTSTGTVTYQVNIRWKKCISSTATRAYAVYASPQICPLSGTYGSTGDGKSYDCVKYIGNPAYNEPGSSLKCSAGTNAACVNTLTFNGARRTENQPPREGDEVRITKSYTISNWNTAKQSSGTTSINSEMCQYYKTGLKFDVDNDNRCINLNIKVNWKWVNPLPEYDARCEIKKINSIDTRVNKEVTLSPGEAFDATFAVRNAGTASWNVVDIDKTNRFRLGSQSPEDTTRWGANRVPITGKQFGGGALSGVGNPDPNYNLSPDFERSFKVPINATPGDDQYFTWQVVHDGGGKPNEGWIGSDCEVIIKIRANRPFLRVSGSDTIAGAIFTNNEDLYESPTASDALIDTNGFNLSKGSSSGQYGVFASGFISSLAVGNFYSNNFNTLEGINDLTFANTNIEPPDSDKYGRFYGDAPLPNIDITSLISYAKGVKEVSVFDNNSFKTHVSVENQNAGGGSAYFSAKGDYSIGKDAFDNVQGSKIIVVNGSLTIDNDLKYTPKTNTNMILVVIGNIYIGSDVSQLDGTYISFPTDETNGIFDTCWQAKGKGEWPDNGTFLSTGVCNKKLTINGRLIASKVFWKRTKGTVGNASEVVDPSCLYVIREYSRCAAEFINFSPEAYFNSPISSSDNRKVENVPSSSIELPPIY